MAELKYNKDMYEFLKGYFAMVYDLLHDTGNRFGQLWGENGDVIETVLGNYGLTHEKFEQTYDPEFDYRKIAHGINDMYARLHDAAYGCDDEESRWYSDSRGSFITKLGCYRKDDESFDTDAFEKNYYAGGFK